MSSEQSDMKKISVMLTSYNLVDYIDESIASVVNQDFPCNWELLIGDDGSTDGTIDKIKLWQEKYPNNIKYIVRNRPQITVKDGYRAGKNRAGLLEMATGDYLIYLDGDDCWLGTEKIKKQFEILEDPNNADCSCCAHNIQAYVIPENRKYSWESESLPTRKFTPKEYWSYHYFHTNTILFRKECKTLLLKDLYRSFLNDNFITFLIIQCGNIYYLNKIWARYNMTGEGLWTGRNKAYSDVRNATTYDLEMQVNPSFRINILRKHWFCLLRLLNDYRDDDYCVVQPIIQNLDPSIFKTTFLLSKKKPYTVSDRIKRMSLRIRILTILFIDKYNKIFHGHK